MERHVFHAGATEQGCNVNVGSCTKTSLICKAQLDSPGMYLDHWFAPALGFTFVVSFHQQLIDSTRILALTCTALPLARENFPL